MEAPQQSRRRPAATYGKSVKKRYSDFDEIFSSATGSSKPKEPSEDRRMASTGATKMIQTSSTTTLVTTTAKTVKAQKNQEKENRTMILPSSTNGGKANLLAKSAEKKAQATFKGKNKRPSPASAMTSPPKHHKVFDFDPSDDDIVQPQIATWQPKGNDEFDVPSSDDEESIAVQKKVLSRRLSKAPAASASMRKFAKEVKPGVADPSARDGKLVRKDVLPKKKEKQIPTGKSITTSKATKPSSTVSKVASKPSKAPQNSNTAPPKSERMVTDTSAVSFTVEIVNPELQRSRATRSQSRQPSAEPEVLQDQQPDQTVRRTKSTQTKSQTSSGNGSTLPHKPAVAKRMRKVVSVPLPAILDESPRVSTSSHQLPPQIVRHDSIPHPPDIFPQVDGLSGKGSQLNTEPNEGSEKIRGAFPRISEIFQNGAEESAPRRRRLIDRLGTATSHLDLMDSSSSEGSDDYSEEEHSPFLQPTSQSRDAFGSQVLDTFMTEQSQEFITEPLVKPVYSNGRIGPKITYARQRSFRTEDLDENALFSAPLIMAQRQHNTGLEEDEELEGDTGSKMMKTIHELREAGVNNRFLDDIEELFGDIEGDTPLSRRRSGYLELALKMRDKAFIGKFRANNCNERLFMNLRKQTDEIVCFSLSFILCCLLLEDTTIQTVSQVRSNGLLPMLLHMLDFEKDIYVIAKDRKTNMSKVAQRFVQDLRTKVEKSPAFAEKKPKVFSPQIMALKVLEESVRKLREAGASDDFLPAGGLGKLVRIMKPFSKGVTKALDTLPLQITVSILESYTIGSRASPEQQFFEAELKIVAELLPAVAGVQTRDMNDILLLILRFGINVTNNCSSICNIFADSSSHSPLVPTLVYMVRDKFNDLARLDLEMEERLVQLDLLVLSLGLLINFAELSDKARYAVVGQGMVLLDVLLHIFLERIERIAEADSVEESHTNVAFGYLSILLGNLCQNTNIREKIRLGMPKATLTPLISSLEEFIAYHRKVDDQYEGYGEGPNAAFTERLEQVVNNLKDSAR